MKTSKRHPRLRGFSLEENKRRYFLHKEIRKLGGVISTRTRVIFVPIEDEIQNPYIIELGSVFGYQIQTEAFTKEQ